jgi:hypothetical protein
VASNSRRKPRRILQAEKMLQFVASSRDVRLLLALEVEAVNAAIYNVVRNALVVGTHTTVLPEVPTKVVKYADS